jgi:hypothetical protein
MPNLAMLPWRKNSEKKLFADDTMPIDIAGCSLFDTMYVHRGVRDSMIVWNFYDFFDLQIGSVPVSGTPSWNAYVATLPDDRLKTAHSKIHTSCSSLLALSL